MAKHRFLSDRAVAWLRSLGAQDPGTTYIRTLAYDRIPPKTPLFEADDE